MISSVAGQPLIRSPSPTVLSVNLSVNFPDELDRKSFQKKNCEYSFTQQVSSALSSVFLASNNIDSYEIRLILPSPDIIQTYQERVKTLHEAAEEEGIEPIASSLDAFFKFLTAAPFKIRSAALFLSDDGSYAAIWRNEMWRLNIKFPSGNVVEYVLLDRTENTPEGIVGRATLEEFHNFITEKDLQSLLQA
ncbi:MAG: hypothetical protein OXC63_12520 [Aestuariivita sp.]|nr:hypothetical protein [Aestuariivita sp.]MCY4346629.1 hypothetical protein [Aestuariivita sp.]